MCSASEPSRIDIGGANSKMRYGLLLTDTAAFPCRKGLECCFLITFEARIPKPTLRSEDFRLGEVGWVMVHCPMPNVHTRLGFVHSGQRGVQAFIEGPIEILLRLTPQEENARRRPRHVAGSVAAQSLLRPGRYAGVSSKTAVRYLRRCALRSVICSSLSKDESISPFSLASISGWVQSR